MLLLQVARGKQLGSTMLLCGAVGQSMLQLRVAHGKELDSTLLLLAADDKGETVPVSDDEADGEAQVGAFGGSIVYVAAMRACESSGPVGTGGSVAAQHLRAHPVSHCWPGSKPPSLFTFWFGNRSPPWRCSWSSANCWAGTATSTTTS